MKRTARSRSRNGGLRSGRILVVAGLVVAGYAGLAARATQLQAVDNDRLVRLARRQVETSLHLASPRGEIRDRNGSLLAVSATVESIAASPRMLSDRKETARQLARALGMRPTDVESKLDGHGHFVWVKRWATPEQSERVRALRLEGVHLHPERRRFYPHAELAGPYLGFADRDGRGLSGLELLFDRALQGEAATLATTRDAVGRKLLPSVGAAPERGASIVSLALDAKLQHAAERALARAVHERDARHGTLVAMDPRTGDILALAEVPGFDPNRFWLEDPERFRARAFVDTFEPGSTLKPFVVALALEAGVVTPDDLFDCENGRWRVANRTIRDFRPHGVLSVREILRVSSNIGVAKIADRLGTQALVDGLRRFGFGAPTGSDYPGESPGLVRELRETQSVERANLSFGQGISVTAVQLANALSILANGGVRVSPRLALREATDPTGAVIGRVSGERVLSEAIAWRVLAMMRDAVRDGTGRLAALPHHAVAGKTGTAQKVVDGSYSQDHYVASFAGVVPADDPRLVVVVLIDEPVEVHTGGLVAAPVFRELASYAMDQLGVPGSPALASPGSAAP
jgi:cell division protein FtsI (penicillin-binding protein 3)